MIFIITLLLCILGCFAQNLTINIFHVGQADSQLLIFPSGYTVLIDLGENRDDFEPTNAKYITKRLTELVPSKTIDVLVLTHIHLDHFGYPANQTGLWYFIEKSGFKIKKYVGRNIGTYDGNDISKCNKDTINWKYVGEYEQYNVDWICYAHTLQNQNYISSIRELADICSTSQIHPPDNNASIQIVMADAFTVKKQDGNLVASDWHDTKDAPSENDYSISLRIQFGEFVYFTGGDLDGSQDFAWGNEISNAEEKIEKIVGSVDVYRVNHHGDYHSSSKSFLEEMKPTASIVSCGDHNRYGLPHQPTMNRLSLYSKTVYLTEDCNSNVTSVFDNVHIMNEDVIITIPIGTNYYEIHDPIRNYTKMFKIKQNKEERKDCYSLFYNGTSLTFLSLCLLLLLIA
ncbi:hypothetical protein EDI_249230 [Entamoeba dispar SAW760]|uniref:Competence protein ComEC n=1 Tax=Entamoeba dispar (strain ATCC PRA-260 / SAW760) TaxID=370354 RepID=B0E974_ENTDS|nr:uncharacterized protein EDI_249230 [Entamoeba dispar SAW760]EDR28903.1 hypothetical protein EDI_249230 [Entamoeba dispar SAW760]|eukprot:EDR28903.1 hypothetical protein EDI_249230 [Entamoeba dispar SAW760]